jgi:hypothetical protein
MWAGVWIDEECHHDALPYLRAIAADVPVLTDQLPPVGAAMTPSYDPTAPEPLRRPAVPAPSRSAPVAVLARSSGHCEVFTERCRYTFDRLVSRHLGQPAIENPSPAALFAACVVCAGTVAGLDPHLAARRGYVVDAGRDPAGVPFHWRSSRWVLLDRDGWLTEMRAEAQTA